MPNFILIYPPQDFNPRFGVVGPDGSLGLLYLASILRDNHYDVKVLDTITGDNVNELDDVFYNHKKIADNKFRAGMSIEKIIDRVKDYNVICISSIFSFGTYGVEDIIYHVKQTYPNKFILLGGVNARSQAKRFFNKGADLICTTEAEDTIIDIANKLKINEKDFSDVKGVIYQKDEKIIITDPPQVKENLDLLPFPAWDLLPLDIYWSLQLGHSGIENLGKYQYMMTSRGCPFSCSFCHISKEKEKGSFTGNIGKYRTKSISRVLDEVDILLDLGVEFIYISDDSFLAKPNRAIKICNELEKKNVQLADVNGVNLVHFFEKKNNKLVLNKRLIDALASAGFKKLIFPVESGSQYILNKFVSGKINLNIHDLDELISYTKSQNIEIGGNYIFGYPHETLEQINATYNLAKQHKDSGLDYVNFHLLTPFPGTVLYDYAIEHNLLDEVDPASYHLYESVMKLEVSNDILTDILTTKWKKLNGSDRIDNIRKRQSSIEITQM